MAGVRALDYDPTPSVNPSGSAGDDYEHIESSPADFGGLIAGATEKAGGALEGAADTALGVMTARQGLMNEVHSSELNTWQADRTTDAFSTFSKLEGRAAQDALPAFKKQIEDIYKKTIDSAGSLQSQAMVAKSGRALTDSYYRYATNHADSQFTTWQTKTSVDRAGSQANLAGLAAGQGDYQGMELHLHTSDDEIRKIYEAKGYDLDSIDQEVTKNRGANLKFIIESRAAAGGPGGAPDPQGAAELYRQYQPQMDPASRLSVETKLKPALLTSAADVGAFAAVGREPPGHHFASAEKEGGLPQGYAGRSLTLNGAAAATPFVIGDSLGDGIRKAAGADGVTTVGRNPLQVLSDIHALKPEQLAGKQIVLSGGASNDPGATGVVFDQINALKNKGVDPASIRLVGVGDRQDFKDQRVNEKLQEIARQTGATFVPVDAASLGPDRVHPKAYGGLASGIGPGAPTPKPQPELPEKAVAYQRVIAATADNPELQKQELAKVDELYRVDAIANETKTAPDRAARFFNLAGLAANENDYPKMESYLDQSDGEIRRGYEKQHIDKESIDDLVTKNRGSNLKYIIESHLAAGGPNGEPDTEGAVGLYAKYKTQMDPASRLAVEEKLKPEKLRSAIDAGAQSAVGRGNYAARAIQVESGGNPAAVSPSGYYRGLGQWSPALERRYGIDDSNRSSPVAQANALMQEAAENRPSLVKVLGREPRDFEYYLAHQQGLGGAEAQLANPDKPAWQNMASTEEGARKGPNWAKAAIWGNMTAQMKEKFPGGVETVTGADFVRSWAQRWNAGGAVGALPDKGVAYQRVMASTQGNPELQQRMLERVNQIYSTEATVNATERATLEQTVPNLIKAAELGVDNVSIPSERIDTVMAPAKAKQWKDEFEMAQQVGGAMRAARWASPEEVAAMQRDIESGQGVLSEVMKTHGRQASTGPGVAGADSEATENQAMHLRLREGMATQFQRLLDQRQEALAKDPAQYVAAHPNLAEAAKGLAKPDPAAYQAYAIASLAIQERLGVGVNERKVLTNGAAEGLAERWSHPDTAGGATAVANEIQQTAQLWGDKWPMVYQQIAPKATPMFRVIGAGVNGAAGKELLESQGVKEEELIRGDPDSTIRKDITTAVAGELKPFAATLPDSDSMRIMADVQQMGERLAAVRLNHNGDDYKAAAKSAVQDIINFKYDFAPTWRIPKTAGVAPAAILAGVVEATRSLGDPSILNAAPIGSAQLGPLAVLPALDTKERGVGEEFLAKETVQRLRDNGVWMTDPHEEGLVLMQPDANPALRPDGKAVKLTWKQLEQLGTAHPGAAAAGARASASMPTGLGVMP